MGWLGINDALTSQMMPYRRAVLYKSILDSFGDDELAKIDIENVIDSVEQKIVSMRKSVVTKNVLIKIVLDTLKPISLRAYIDYLSKHTNLQNMREVDRILKQI